MPAGVEKNAGMWYNMEEHLPEDANILLRAETET